MQFLEKIGAFVADLARKFITLKLWQQLLTLVFALFLFTVFVDIVVMPLYTRHGSEYDLPDVTEKNIDSAFEILQDNGFIPIIQDSVFDNFYSKGTVLRQNPAPFSLVKKGRRVYLMVSNGEKPIFMPKLVSETLINAELKLREFGLKVGRVAYDYSTTYPYRDIVISQSVSAGSRVSNNQTIDLTVSLGAPSASLVMPNLNGKSLNSARRELEILGLPAGSVAIRYRYLPNLVPHTVVAQSVSPGTALADLDGVELTVSTDQIPGRQ